MSQSGDDEAETARPERTCVVTSVAGSPDAMIRFVRGPDNRVTPDLRRKLPGRGVWVTASAKTVAEAIKKGSFARGFKGPATVEPTLVEDLDALLERDALQFLSLANKAGQAVAGFTRVEAMIATGKCAVLVHASDAAADGRRKIEQISTRSTGGPVERINLFDSAQLGLALGRSHVIHAALAAGPATGAFVARCRKLANFRGVAPDAAGAN